MKLSLPSRQAAQALPGEQNVSAVANVGDFFGGVGQGHLAAEQGAGRGYVYWPQFDTRKEITAYSRMQMTGKSRFLYANVGFYRRIVNGVSRMVAGTGLMPHPQTDSRDWNKLALKRLEAIWGSASTYDLGGNFTGYRAQRAKLRCRYKDSDVATILTRAPDGRATTAIYEAHQIGSGKVSVAEQQTLFDGVHLDANGRTIALRLLGADGAQVDVPSSSALLLVDRERPGQPRGLPIGAHAINNLLDKTEIDAAFKGNIKTSSRIGYYIGAQKDVVQTTQQKPGGSIGNRQTSTLATGQKVNLEKVFGAHGGEVQELDPGREIKLLLDERPHPNTLGFLEYLIRDISLGVDLSPEVLWSIVKLGGANVRFVMADAQSFVEQEQQILIDTTLGLEYIWFLADEIASGRLPKCPDPQWWKHTWITPARWTVDIGRDGKLHLEQLRSGALTFRRFFGWQGLGLEELDEWMDEYQYISEGAKARGLDPEKVLANIYGRPSMPTPAGQAPDGSADTPVNE